MRNGMVTRRQALGLAGGAGAAYAVGGLVRVGSGDSAVGVGEAGAQAATCTLAPEVTQGPYWVDERLNRSDVTTGAGDGIPLSLTFTVLNSETCSAFGGAWVDIWHCNAPGLYSDVAGEGTTGQTFLRGYQVTDSSGQCTFETIFPGWYTGRTVHIHVRVRTFDRTETTYNFPTQVFFTEANTATVMATSAYQKSGTRTTNSQDNIYGEEVQKGNALVVPLSGNTVAGYSGTMQISLAGLPASAGTTEDKKLSAGVRSAKFMREANGMRFLDVKVKANEKIGVNAQLVRNGKVIAHKRIDALAANGIRTVSVPVPNKVDAGRARLRVKMTDRLGNRRVVNRTVQVPAFRG